MSSVGERTLYMLSNIRYLFGSFSNEIGSDMHGVTFYPPDLLLATYHFFRHLPLILNIH